MTDLPRYLQGHATHLAEDPRAVNRRWFAQAGSGLFLHYGLYAQLERHEWVMHREAIPVADYERLAETFNPSAFDADLITDLALEAGMGYITFTTCHHEGFCLWDSQVEPFNSQRVAGRDLFAELGEQCDRKGLGLFAYFTYALNWRHPYALTREHLLGSVRPAYPHGDPRYVLTTPEEWTQFWEWSLGCLGELCQRPYPVAGLWLDIIMAAYLMPEAVPVQQTYELIRRLHPYALVSYKQGATGDEDFAAPEFSLESKGDTFRSLGHHQAGARADLAWERNKGKHNEICMSLQKGSWGYAKDLPHVDADTVWSNLAYAANNHCNLLVNVGPRPDGSIHPTDIATLKEIGRRRRSEGLPTAAVAARPSSEASGDVE